MLFQNIKLTCFGIFINNHNNWGTEFIPFVCLFVYGLTYMQDICDSQYIFQWKKQL